MTYTQAIDIYNARIGDTAFCAMVSKLQARFVRAGQSLDDAFSGAVGLALKLT